MRTGSNFLEANLNMFDGVACLGEAFNPHFIGFPNTPDLLGMTQSDRESDPQALIDRVKQTEGLNGFRFFNDHDSRVLDIALTDPRCAKIVLTRNPVDSFVSWKIASATGQWKLTNVTHAKTQQVNFDGIEFETHVAALQAFQTRILNTLQRSGQTAFYVAYEDLQDVEVMNGLVRWLGVDSHITSLNKTLKKQNPDPMADKVANFAQMETALARMDRFNLTRTPNFEPRRGPMIPTYVAAPHSPLLYMPLKSGPNAVVQDWLAAVDEATVQDLQTGFSQKSLRDWLRAHPGHSKFSVVRHPVIWAHTAFCERIVANGPGSFAEIRATLRKVHGVEVPDGGAVPETDVVYNMLSPLRVYLPEGHDAVTRFDHLLVAHKRGTPTISLVIGFIHSEFHASFSRPLFANSIDSPRTSREQCHIRVGFVQLVELTVHIALYLILVLKLARSGDHDDHPTVC